MLSNQEVKRITAGQREEVAVGGYSYLIKKTASVRTYIRFGQLPSHVLDQLLGNQDGDGSDGTDEAPTSNPVQTTLKGLMFNDVKICAYSVAPIIVMDEAQAVGNKVYIGDVPDSHKNALQERIDELEMEAAEAVAAFPTE